MIIFYFSLVFETTIHIAILFDNFLFECYDCSKFGSSRFYFSSGAKRLRSILALNNHNNSKFTDNFQIIHYVLGINYCYAILVL